MATTTTVVVGAGHAGLAMSHRLTERSIEHVVLERGAVANSWATERWDSLRLLTPNWQTRLPGGTDRIGDPDGFMTAPEVADLVRDYAVTIGAPVRPFTTVTRVAPAEGGYTVTTDDGGWRCAAVVLAGGACNRARLPAVACAVPPEVASLTAMTYKRPDQLAEGGVLVVGASASGVQIADELCRSGRPVTLAVGEHVRMPRRYRGRDVFWWLEATGVLDERHDEIDDLVRARHLPSPQLVGSPEGRSIDLGALADRGVRLVGRLTAVSGGSFRFSGGLANVCALADLKLNRLLARFDEWATAHSGDGLPPPTRYAPTPVPSPPLLELPIGQIATVVWATGYLPDHSWLDVPVFDRAGAVRHRGGVVSDAPGLYLVGANLLRRRRSSYIAGAAADSDELAAELHAHLDRVATGRRR